MLRFHHCTQTIKVGNEIQVQQIFPLNMVYSTKNVHSRQKILIQKLSEIFLGNIFRRSEMMDSLDQSYCAKNTETNILKTLLENNFLRNILTV